MPKDTFYNLSDEKKQRIFDAAVQEFSTRRFSEASINKIVKAAGIPWGSFYQYFNNKEDLYQYMFERIGEEKKEIVRDSKTIYLEADFFAICIQSTIATFEWVRHNPEYMRISILMEIDDSEFISSLRKSIIQILGRYIERDKQRGLIKPEIDSNLVADMVYTLIWKQASMLMSDEEMFFKKLSEGIKIVREGITNPK